MKMFKKVVKAYYDLFDTKIKNWTLVVLIVSLLILAIWFFSNQEKSLTHLKTSLYDSYKL